MRNVLIIDGSVYPDIYRPNDEWTTALGDVPSTRVHISFGDQIPPLERFSHIILTGSEASITRPEPWFAPMENAVRAAFDAEMPILGSCFGHQMLARALWGERHVRASATPEIGWIEVDILTDDPLLRDVPRPWHVFASHFDEVIDVPEGWEITARTERCAVHVMRHLEKPIWGVQAHPEIPPDHAQALMRGFCRYFPDKASLLEPALVQSPRDDHVAQSVITRFLTVPA